MVTSELMLGDYLYVWPSNMVIKVAAIHKGKVGYHACTNKLSWVRVGLLRPIPITLEILEKNDFKKFPFLHIEGQHQWIFWGNTLISVTLWCRELNDDTKDGMMLKIEAPTYTLCIKVNYVHEFQHALTICGIDKKIEI